MLVCDPRSHEARARVVGMLCALGAVDVKEQARGQDLVTGSGRGWAAAAIAPPAVEPTCGADIYTDGRDVLVWAGEVFLPPAWRGGIQARNPQENTSAALLRRLQTLGVEALADVDGAFCGAWYDRSRDRWVVFNDKLGLVPVFFWAQDDRLTVSPKAWLTWQATGETLEVSRLGVADLLRTENMVADHTLIKGIHWLEAGHALEWGANPLHCRSYWDFHYRPPAADDENEAIDRCLAVLVETVQRHTACESPLMLGISGGLDSRMFLAVCERIGRIPACFTAGWSFADDVRYGRRLARLARAAYEWVPLDEYSMGDRLVEAIIETDGLHSVAHLAPATAITAYLQSHTGSVLLEGYLQGVLGGAYVPEDEDVAPQQPAHRSPWARERLHAGGDFDLIDGLLQPELAMESCRRWKARIDDTYRRAPADDPLEKAEYTIASGRSGRIDVPGTALLRRDVLVRNPACDRLMLDWHAGTPARMRRGKRLFMELIRRRFPRFARVQRTGYSGLPITENRWLRQYHWQREKVYRWWLARRFPRVRQWGTGGRAMRAWTFDTWRRTGGLDLLTDPDARVLNWVERERLLNLWDQAPGDPAQVGPLLSLATIEIMVRRLEALPRSANDVQMDLVRFGSFDGPAAPGALTVTTVGA